MVNYGNGKVYKIISNQTDKIYIGSTTKKYLSSRMDEHRNRYKFWKDGTQNYTSSFEILEYGDAKIILLENYPCKTKDELRAREQYFIDQMKDLCVNMLKSFRTLTDLKEYQKKQKKEYYISNKYKLKEYQIGYQINNCDKIKERKKEKILCIYCDCEITNGNLARHNKSENHISNVEIMESL